MPTQVQALTKMIHGKGTSNFTIAKDEILDSSFFNPEELKDLLKEKIVGLIETRPKSIKIPEKQPAFIKKDLVDLSIQNVSEALELLSVLAEPKELERYLDQENKGKKRSRILRFIKDRLVELYG